MCGKEKYLVLIKKLKRSWPFIRTKYADLLTHIRKRRHHYGFVILEVIGAVSLWIGSSYFGMAEWLKSALIAFIFTVFTSYVLLFLKRRQKHDALLRVIVLGYLEGLHRCGQYLNQYLEERYSYSKPMLDQCRMNAGILMSETEDSALAEHLFWLTEGFSQIELQFDRASQALMKDKEALGKDDDANPLKWIGAGLAFLKANNERLFPALSYCINVLTKRTAEDFSGRFKKEKEAYLKAEKELERLREKAKPVAPADRQQAPPAEP
jgi:hypothetical protein